MKGLNQIYSIETNLLDQIKMQGSLQNLAHIQDVVIGPSGNSTTMIVPHVK